MVTIAQPLYALPTNPSVKWLATQERNLNRELPYPDAAAETAEEYVSRTYLQFLWLPQVRLYPYPSAVRFSRISCLISAVTDCGELYNASRAHQACSRPTAFSPAREGRTRCGVRAEQPLHAPRVRNRTPHSDCPRTRLRCTAGALRGVALIH